MSKGFFDGSYRVETFQYMAAMCIEFTAIILLLGMTGLGRVITEKIPNALKSGIILGAALAAFHQIFFSDYERYIGCLLYTSPSPRDAHESRMPSSA